MVLENRGEERARIARRIGLERATAAHSFEAASETESFALRHDCEDQSEDCIELLPGAALHPPAWEANGQCGSCPSCTAMSAGTYRAIVTSCGGAHRVESEPFTIGQR